MGSSARVKTATPAWASAATAASNAARTASSVCFHPAVSSRASRDGLRGAGGGAAP